MVYHVIRLCNGLLLLACDLIFLYILLSRNAMRKCGLCCRPVSVRPSACLSVMLVDCIQMAEDIVKLLVRPGSHITLVFRPPAPIPNSNGNPFSGGTNYKVVGKFCDFSRKSPSISETARDRPMVAMER